MRTFHSSRAVRANVPLLIALIGPSGGGKSYSALRLAAGMQRVQPGDVHVIDTEADRALQYADKFAFQHMPFGAPFDSLSYLDAMRQCEKEGARTIIVDSMSHEHEGPGGVLEQADDYIVRTLKRKQIERDSDRGWVEEQKLKRSAWIEPKQKRTKLINGMTQLRCNVILCFRAKEGTDQIKEDGKTKIIKLGWIPIGGDAFWYEMTARALLPPGANGIPEWRTGNLEKGEKIAVRRPEQFASILRDGAQLSEDMGEAMARWAMGDAKIVPTTVARELGLDAAGAMLKINECETADALRSVARQISGLTWTDAQRKAIKATIDARSAALKNTTG